MTRVLILDSDDARSLHLALTSRGIESVCIPAPEALADVPRPTEFEAIILVLSSDLGASAELCRSFGLSHPGAGLIAVGPFTSVQGAGVLLAAGADDFVAAPVDLDEVVLSVNTTIHRRSLIRAAPRSAVRRGRAIFGMGELLGQSPAMQEVYAMIERVAASDSTVLIAGETGTGKELAARTLHVKSGRAGAFVAVNCASLPESLLESELFGHARGAFTDAKAPRPGLFVVAQGGTIFLDEIGETSPALQAKLLRALQERMLRPVGSDHEMPFDARVIVATNRDLDAEIASGRFRADLYYRVQVIQLSLPPLRARGADALLLARHFLSRCAARTEHRVRSFTSTAESRLISYPWPGNVRELQNAIERAVAMGGRQIDVGDLPERIRRHRLGASGSPSSTALLTLAELERQHVQEVMSLVGGRRSEAARILGIDRKTLYRKLTQYGLYDETRNSDEPGVTRAESPASYTKRLRRPRLSRAKG